MFLACGMADPPQSRLTGSRAKLWSSASMSPSKRTSRALFTMLWLVVSLAAWMDYAWAHSAPVPVGLSHHDSHHDGDAGTHEAVERLIGAVEDSRPDRSEPLLSAPDFDVHFDAILTSVPDLGHAKQLVASARPFRSDPDRSSQALRDLATVRLLI